MFKLYENNENSLALISKLFFFRINKYYFLIKGGKGHKEYRVYN